ncbi:MAG: VOC family protein [Candidatus Omnitrophica bacterium]|nr:VOC family protein [Candidatus Omnitrophota bacterium]
MNIQGIDHVAVSVRDLDKAVEFYTKILGLKITEREYNKPGIEYFLDAGPSLIGLIQGDLKGPHHLFQHEGIGANHFSFRIKTKDFDATLEKLKTAGVEIIYSKKREKSWSIYFKDLDGNKLELTAWPLEEK